MANKERTESILKWLEQQGLQRKYHHPGIYSISIAGRLVYIGKSLDMLTRVAQHMAEIEFPKEQHKYQVLARAREQGYSIDFDVMYYSETEGDIEDDIGRAEGRLIRKYRPPLNYQVPKEDNYHSFTVNRRAKWVTLEEILGRDPDGFNF